MCLLIKWFRLSFLRGFRKKHNIKLFIVDDKSYKTNGAITNPNATLKNTTKTPGIKNA